MPQLKRSETQRPRTAPASQRLSSSLDLSPLHQALPRVPVVSQQKRNLISSTPRQQQQANGTRATGSLLPSVQRTSRRPSTTENTRVSSLPKSPSTAEGSRVISAPISAPTRWERPTLAESKKLFSIPGKAPRRPPHSHSLAGRKGAPDATKFTENGGMPKVARLPPDLLCQCFISIESLYYLVNCASVCRSWREALQSDEVWKTMYLKWWHSVEVEDSLEAPTSEETRAGARLPAQDTRSPPPGYDSWRSAFIARFQDGKKELVVRDKARAVREGFLHVRQVRDARGKTALDCAQGDGMQKLAERLGLSFSMCLNRGRHVKIQGKGKVDIFQSSCVFRYPASCIGNLNLSALKSVEVTATSDRLLRVCPIIDLHTRLPVATWETVSVASRSPGPLRLLQRQITSGVSLIVGTLAEDVNLLDGINGAEQVLLVVVSFHLSDLLWKLMDIGEGSSSRAARAIVRDDLDPHYGLHNWQVSVQFHSFGRNIWTRNFKQVFWDTRESIPGEKAVFLLVSHHEVFPGVLKLPWKSEAFSGSLTGVYLLDITLWDGGGEIAWQTTSAVRIDPAPLAVVEYGIEFDGERVHTHVLDSERGVSVQINMCIPLSMSHWQATDERPILAITNLQVGLTNKFLEEWCGVANI